MINALRKSVLLHPEEQAGKWETLPHASETPPAIVWAEASDLLFARRLLADFGRIDFGSQVYIVGILCPYERACQATERES